MLTPLVRTRRINSDSKLISNYLGVKVLACRREATRRWEARKKEGGLTPGKF